MESSSHARRGLPGPQMICGGRHMPSRHVDSGAGYISLTRPGISRIDVQICTAKRGHHAITTAPGARPGDVPVIRPHFLLLPNEHGSTAMTLVQLRCLVAIADAGLNITLAAERVHATQPGLSKQLKQLEDELG